MTEIFVHIRDNQNIYIEKEDFDYIISFIKKKSIKDLFLYIKWEKMDLEIFLNSINPWSKN